jgi:hypothetical protein
LGATAAAFFHSVSSAISVELLKRALRTNVEMTNRIDGGSCPQSPAAHRRGGSGELLRASLGRCAENAKENSVSDSFSKSIRPYGTPGNNWSPGLLAGSGQPTSI